MKLGSTRPVRALRMWLGLAACAMACAHAHGEPLLACGSDEVRLYDVSGDRAKLMWTWSARMDRSLPDGFRNSGLFDRIDECKPVLDGSAVLVTASTDGVALVDMASGHARFWARVAMAHSAEVLPGNRVIVAASLAPQGNRLEIYDIAQPGRVLYATELHSGHGVVWDARRAWLYALGFDAVRAYSLEDWNSSAPRLQLRQSWPLPGKADGHDLTRLPGSGDLLVTTDDGVWRFEPESGRYATYEPLAGLHNVKAVSVEPRSGRIAFQQPEERWWSHHIRLREPEGAVEVQDLRLYKVRWLASGE